MKGLDDLDILTTFLQNNNVDTTDENGKIFVIKGLINFKIMFVVKVDHFYKKEVLFGT